MIVWIIILAIITVLSYLADIGVFIFLNEMRIPFLNASIVSVLLLAVTVVMLIRILIKIKTREKELMGTKITQLERELDSFKQKVDQ